MTNTIYVPYIIVRKYEVDPDDSYTALWVESKEFYGTAFLYYHDAQEAAVKWFNERMEWYEDKMVVIEEWDVECMTLIGEER